MHLTSLALLAVALTGCAQTAVVKCWEPAEIDVAGIHSVVVTNFSGDNGPEMAAALAHGLARNDFYAVVAQSELGGEIQNIGFDSDAELDLTFRAAAAADVDGLIFGEVIDYQCDDELVESADLRMISESANSSFNRTPIAMTSKPFIERRATVTVAVQLVDVQTGEVRATRQLSRSESRDFSAESAIATEKSEMLDELSNLCLQEFVGMLAPHEMACEMKLVSCDFFAAGHGKVKCGLRMASRGDWKGAEEQWQSAIEENPENHAAMFDLSIAAARRQDYDLAETYILEALKHEHSRCYTQGLEQIRQRRTAWDRAAEQRDSRVVSADPMRVW